MQWKISVMNLEVIHCNEKPAAIGQARLFCSRKEARKSVILITSSINHGILETYEELRLTKHFLKRVKSFIK